MKTKYEFCYTKNGNNMKARKFEKVQLHQEVTFEENGLIETGIVCKVTENTFTLRALRCWNKDGIMSYNDHYFNFKKTGTKGSHRNTYGNAIEMKSILL